MNRSFWIGVYPGLTEEMIGFVVSEFERFSTGRAPVLPAGPSAAPVGPPGVIDA